jgi:hypothetical protein
MEEDEFCGDCGNQVRCHRCHGVLKTNKRFCTKCGAPVGEGDTSSSSTDNVTAPQVGTNTVEYREARASRYLRAEFTDTTAGNLVAPLSAALGGRISPATLRNRSVPTTDPIVIDGEPLPLPTPSEVTTGAERLVPAGVAATRLAGGLERIFWSEGNQLRLREPRLKGHSKLDTARRLTYLFLYAHTQLGRHKVPLADLFAVLDEAGVDDRNTRAWIRRSSEVWPDGEMIGLRPAGEEKAEAALADFLSPERPDGWTADTAKARAPRSAPRRAEAGKDKAKPTPRTTRGRSTPTTVSKWVTAWKQLDLPVHGHAVLKSRTPLDQGILGLWAIHEAIGDPGKVVTSKSLAKFLLEAFVIKVDSRKLDRAFDKDNNDKVLKVGGTRYQITPTGIAYAREMAGLPSESLRAVPTSTTPTSASGA